MASNPRDAGNLPPGFAGLHPPTAPSQSGAESSENRRKEKFAAPGRRPFQFMESISTQSGEDDFVKHTGDYLDVSSYRGVYGDSSSTFSARNDLKLSKLNNPESKEELLGSQFNFNLNLLKKLTLSNVKLNAPLESNLGTQAKVDQPLYHSQRNLLLKKTKDRFFPANANPLVEPRFTKRTDQMVHGKETLLRKDLPVTLGSDSKDNLKKLESQNASLDFLSLLESQVLPNPGKPFSKNLKTGHSFVDSRSTPSQADTSIKDLQNESLLPSVDLQNTPNDSHQSLKDARLMLLRNPKPNFRDSQSTNKYLYQTQKGSPSDSQHLHKDAKLTLLREHRTRFHDSHKGMRASKHSVKEGVHAWNESHLKSSRDQDRASHILRPSDPTRSREERPLFGETQSGHTVDLSYLRNPAARVKSVQFWFKPFSTAKASNLNSSNGLQVIESLTGNVQKSWHLEAIKGLDRQNYSELKMTMLRLTNSRFNIHPNRLLIHCRGSWDVIQEGSFGTVYLGFVEGFGNSAVKVPNANMLSYDSVGVMKRFINEWDILTRCSHRNIVSIYGGIILGLFDIWLCTELVNGVDLHTVKYGSPGSLPNGLNPFNAGPNVSKHGTNSTHPVFSKSNHGMSQGGRPPRLIPVNAALKMCRQLADVLVYLHTPTRSKGVVIHRDIKPENIIVDADWNIKLCDFGDAFESSSGQVSAVSGATWLYAPPELLLHPSIKNDAAHAGERLESALSEFEPGSNEEGWSLSEKWDIWSVGCVLQEMFGYSGPFHHLVSMNDPPNVVCEKMVRAAARGLVPNIPNQLAKTKMGALILQCLDPNPENRPTAREIKHVLSTTDVLSP